jgi:hypothetical protein
MSTNTHPVAPEEVMALLDGELSAERAQALSAHIDQCPECREVQATIRATSQKLAAWNVDAPRQLQERVFLKDVQTGRSQQGGVVSLSWLHDTLVRKRIWAPALAFVVIVIAVAGAFTNLSFRPKTASQSVSTAALTGHKPFDNHKAISVDRAEVNSGSGPADYFAEAPPPPPPSGGPQAGAGSRPTPMIARTVSLSIVVKDFDASRAVLDAILSRHNGYAAGLNVVTPQGAARALQASLRIPAPQLTTVVAELKALGRVEAEAQNGEEVTQQLADLVARLKNSRETEQRLQAILLQRTGKISDVLSVEQEIARVRGEIEQMEAEQQTLEHRVEFATIDLKLAEEYKAQLSPPAPSVASQVRNASVNGFRNAFESLLALILFFAEAAPTLLLWLLLLSVPAWYFWRRYRRAFAMS